MRWTLLLVACTPVLPFPMAETADTLPKHAGSLTLTGGGGGGNFTVGGGGAVRVSGGLTDRQELGADFGVAGNGDAIFLSGKARYKLRLVPHLALVAGLGLVGFITLKGGSGSDPGAGGDLALVASTGRSDAAGRFYSGVRFTFTVPLAGDVYKSSLGGPTQGFILPIGLALRLSPGWVLFLEAGATLGVEELRIDNRFTATGLYAGYGALAFAYSWMP